MTIKNIPEKRKNTQQIPFPLHPPKQKNTNDFPECLGPGLSSEAWFSFGFCMWFLFWGVQLVVCAFCFSFYLEVKKKSKPKKE